MRRALTALGLLLALPALAAEARGLPARCRGAAVCDGLVTSAERR